GVLITMDTTNAGALDIYGKDRGLTPRLKALATESVIFDNAHTVAPITLPAHTSMLTGLYPLRHGVRENGIMKLSLSAETLAERASESGFQTAAFVSAPVLFARYGLDQGFDVYDQPADTANTSRAHVEGRSSKTVTNQALNWLRTRDQQRPFFLWIHYFNPHLPYAPPAEFMRKAGGNEYFAEVAAMDHDIGRLIDGLAEVVGLDKLTLAVVADHGEAFQAHGEPTHAVFCYDATVRVPFLLRFPDGRRAGTRTQENVSVVDLFPTFLEELGLGTAADADGISLASNSVPEDRGVYMESYSGYLSYGWSPISGWLDSDGKYLHSSEPEFYHLAKDPKEEVNLLADGAMDVSRYTDAIRELSRLPRLQAGGDVDLTPQQIRDLNALGYVAAGQDSKILPDPLDPSDLLSPVTQADVYAKSSLAIGLVGAGMHERAIPLLLEIISTNPEDIYSLQNLGLSMVAMGRFYEAIDPLEQALLRSPQHQQSRVCLGLAYEQTGELKKSLMNYKQAEVLLPGARGVAEAIARLEAAIARD
ncbi:MAG: choline-sulfatase, partial [Candidatus Paceibacteria bacterium]